MMEAPQHPRTLVQARQQRAVKLSAKPHTLAMVQHYQIPTLVPFTVIALCRVMALVARLATSRNLIPEPEEKRRQLMLKRLWLRPHTTTL